jgi:mycoredoxin
MTENIVMYGADRCGDCRRSKAFLERHGVAFTYVDLEERPEEMQTVIARNGGMRSIPVIVFDDGSHLTEPTNDALATKLGL